MVQIIIDGNPVPWAAHGGYGRRSYDKRFAEKEYYRFQIRRQYTNNNPIETAVKIEYLFAMAVPASKSKKERDQMISGKVRHIKKPDTSNLVKLAEDTLKGIVIKDDAQVIEFTAFKFYSEKPQTIINVSLA